MGLAVGLGVGLGVAVWELPLFPPLGLLAELLLPLLSELPGLLEELLLPLLPELPGLLEELLLPLLPELLGLLEELLLPLLSELPGLLEELPLPLLLELSVCWRNCFVHCCQYFRFRKKRWSFVLLFYPLHFLYCCHSSQ